MPDININWEPFISTRSRRTSHTLPQITIAKDTGRIAINSASCELIPNIYTYNYAEIYCGSINEKLKKIRIQFTNEKTFKSVPLTRKKYKGSYTAGVMIHSKSLVKNIYTVYPSFPRTCHFSVEAQNTNGHPSLCFDFQDSLIDPLSN